MWIWHFYSLSQNERSMFKINQYNNIVKYLYLPRYLKRRLPKDIVLISINSVESRKLNRLYRYKNKAANVLSFRYSPDYGEILVCPEIIRKEAKSQGNSYKYQMTWMIMHGMLHLAGIHHEKSRVIAGGVERLEQKILRALF